MEKFLSTCSTQFVNEKLYYALHLIEKAINSFGIIGILLDGSEKAEILKDMVLTFFTRNKGKVFVIRNSIGKSLGNQGELRENELFCVMIGDLAEDRIIYNCVGDSQKLCPLLNWEKKDVDLYITIQKVIIFKS